jgi:hypothetical protein
MPLVDAVWPVVVTPALHDFQLLRFGEDYYLIN